MIPAQTIVCVVRSVTHDHVGAGIDRRVGDLDGTWRQNHHRRRAHCWVQKRAARYFETKHGLDTIALEGFRATAAYAIGQLGPPNARDAFARIAQPEIEVFVVRAARDQRAARRRMNSACSGVVRPCSSAVISLG